MNDKTLHLKDLKGKLVIRKELRPEFRSEMTVKEMTTKEMESWLESRTVGELKMLVKQLEVHMSKPLRGRLK